MSDKLHILQHSLGLNQYGEGSQYRNHFCAGGKDIEICRQLVVDGLMCERPATQLSGGDPVFVVTTAGKDFVALNSPQRPPVKKMTRSQRNYNEYLLSDCGMSFAEYMGFGRQRPWHLGKAMKRKVS